ncbi:MFS transporter [Kineosporia sp. J2-2]|uniref:MFS transporter n=1 Tax=Kineosporia corallincola TaxID=2835133 RepID=A0ABS5TAF8_9ACTN|nr:MFS transporter [Kineosporia corallincola]MBT0768057.1 MFS transporter [Kineosporia corallincola]
MTTTPQQGTGDGRTLRSNLPARLDRLPWSSWHLTVLIGLGTVWILDGLEVTIVGALGDRLTESGSGLELSASQVGQAAAIYVAGACLGALFFGQLTEKYGRRKLFMITLGLYLAATVLTAFSMNPLFFFVCRFFTGAGIGGEYAAINSAIDELMPARLRGRIDLMINGSYWLGAAVGAALTLVLLDTDILPADVGWRLAFGLGAVLGLVILLVRRNVPESPRWLTIHGKHEEAEGIVDHIEHVVEHQDKLTLEPVPDEKSIAIRERGPVKVFEIIRTMLRTYPSRSALGLGLFVGQAFLYNAVFFTQGLVLTKFFDVGSGTAGLYIIPLAVGNFLGPVLLGPFFDTVGRRMMITLSYVVSSIALIFTAVLFQQEVFGAATLTVAWSIVFFFASAGASSAYLTVSEIFPMETRAMAIAFFYAVGTGLGGIIGPLLFGRLVETESFDAVAGGYYLGAGLMLVAGLLEWWLGVDAENRNLEDIASPISSAGPTVSS